MANSLDFTYTFQIAGEAPQEFKDCPPGAFGNCGQIDYDGRYIYSLFPEAYKIKDLELGYPLRTFLDGIDQLFATLLSSVKAFPCIVDPDRCPAQYLDHILRQIGNPFQCATDRMDCVKKRKTAKHLVLLYRYKGTAVGVTYALKLLFGYTSKVVEYFPDCWILGVSRLGEENTALCPNFDPWILGHSYLGEDTYVGSNKERKSIYTFRVYIDATPEDDDLKNCIEQTIVYMKPKHTHHEIEYALGASGVAQEDFEDVFELNLAPEFDITAAEDFEAY